MPIIVRLDVMLAKRGVKAKDLASHIGITEANCSLLRTGKVKGVRFGTLEKICDYLECQPGEILEYQSDENTTIHPKPD
ncbi:MAG: helix-turn-helix transcriptional regulator [Verrucomicrobiota bacterium]